MKNRMFNGGDGEVSEVGLGCWQFGGDWGEVSEDEALAILRASAEKGVTLFDTADVYGGGRSESLIGKFLGETREKIFVATKLGRAGDPGGAANFTRQSVRAHTEASLRRLGLETVDLTQLHCIPAEVRRIASASSSLTSPQSPPNCQHPSPTSETSALPPLNTLFFMR